ncbi:LppX_LprAFG lipoprotein [Nocardioides sp. URHA0020]|uniref:LppX_LprAFG lipoprotein n=1 Tax=Nocardioides sp. URHA0020 TaxID=1380392 RepID=UPI00048E84EC|nr:LppX_LprAFG lipoprotein [Nocardioides sp. URHA0020]
MTRPHPLRRTLAVAALAPLLGLGLAACGDDQGGQATGATTVRAAALTGLGKGDTVAPGELVDVIADGVKSSTSAHTTLRMSLGKRGDISGDGVVDYTSTKPEAAFKLKMKVLGQSVDTDVRIVDGLVYVSLGQLGGGTFWKIDPSDESMSRLGLGSMLDQTDPIGAIEKLEPAIDQVTYVGDEDVEGRDLHHYELTVDLAAAADELGAQLPDKARDSIPTSVTYDLWLDGDNRFAQMEMDYPVMGSTASVELTASDWGKDVTIEAPPADKVTEMPDLGETR